MILDATHLKLHIVAVDFDSGGPVLNRPDARYPPDVYSSGYLAQIDATSLKEEKGLQGNGKESRIEGSVEGWRE